MNRIKVPRPVSGGLMLSYKCTAACRHCIYICSPEWEADWISESDLEKGLSVLAEVIEPSPYGPDYIGLNDGLHFTGGEPFLNFRLLLRAVEIAAELRIPSLFVETNCYWSTSDKVTREKLEALREKGLKGIMISVNPFYAEYIPFERTERCVRISRDIFGDNVFVYQAEYYRLFKSLEIKKKIAVEDFLALTKHKYFSGMVELFFMGRAAYKLKSHFPVYPAQALFTAPCITPFLRSWHNHFDNYGNYMPGFCGGISLGSWYNLHDLLKHGLDAARYPVVNYLAYDDMEGLFKFAAEYGYVESKSGYLSKCDLCLDIRKHLALKDKFEELEPKEFYIHS